MKLGFLLFLSFCSQAAINDDGRQPNNIERYDWVGHYVVRDFNVLGVVNWTIIILLQINSRLAAWQHYMLWIYWLKLLILMVISALMYSLFQHQSLCFGPIPQVKLEQPRNWRITKFYSNILTGHSTHCTRQASWVELLGMVDLLVWSMVVVPCFSSQFSRSGICQFSSGLWAEREDGSVRLK